MDFDLNRVQGFRQVWSLAATKPLHSVYDIYIFGNEILHKKSSYEVSLRRLRLWESKFASMKLFGVGCIYNFLIF